jgi:hypothetical protein
MDENEPLRTSLAGVDRGLTALWVDGTAKDFATLREFEALTLLQVYRLRAGTSFPAGLACRG